jgi:hypothetical protein
VYPRSRGRRFGTSNGPAWLRCPSRNVIRGSRYGRALARRASRDTHAAKRCARAGAPACADPGRCYTQSSYRSGGGCSARLTLCRIKSCECGDRPLGVYAIIGRKHAIVQMTWLFPRIVKRRGKRSSEFVDTSCFTKSISCLLLVHRKDTLRPSASASAAAAARRGRTRACRPCRSSGMSAAHTGCTTR